MENVQENEEKVRRKMGKRRMKMRKMEICKGKMTEES